MAANALSASGSECQGLHSSLAALMPIAVEGKSYKLQLSGQDEAHPLSESVSLGLQFSALVEDTSAHKEMCPKVGAKPKHPYCSLHVCRVDVRLFMGNPCEVLLCNLLNIKEWRNAICVCT